jgi:periplasmic protein TonB
MLTTLLESKSNSKRSPAGTIVSVLAHTGLIAAAVYATAQAHVPPTRAPTTVRPVYFPRVTAPTPAVHTTGAGASPATPTRLLFVRPVIVDVPVPIDLSSMASRPSDFPSTAILGGVRSSPGGGDPSATFSADQVEKQVAVAPGSLPPRYPETLRNAGVQGQVTAMFVVDESGRAEDSVRFLHGDNALFEDAVRAALRRMRFTPAEVGGRKVRQLVQMPFVFTLKK